MATEAIIFQQIVDINWDQAIYTASPNNTINVVQFAAKGSATNIGIALTPKGTGYISAHVPDGTAAGGNARGARAVDLQTQRSAAGSVASGARAFIGAGDGNTASGADSGVVSGLGCTASGQRAIAGGSFCVASGLGSVAFGAGSTASNTGSVAVGSSCAANGTASHASGLGAIAHLGAMRAHGSGGLTFSEALQEFALVLGGVTTTNSEVILSLGVPGRPVLRANSTWCGVLHIIGARSTGAAIASYHRQVTINRTGNTTSIVGAINVIGADEAAGTSVNITADDTNEALSVGVTGVASQTWRWGAVFHGVEILHGT